MSPMTSRERVERAIRFETPDRVPFNFWMDRRRMAEFDAKFGDNFRVSHYGADVVESFAIPPFPTGKMESGMGTQWLVEPLFECFTQADQIALPDPSDPDLLKLIEQDLKTYKDKAVIADLPNVLSMVEQMRPQAQLYLDMMMYPEEVKRFFHRMSDVMAAAAERICKLDITALYVMDDVAFNSGLLMSNEMWREFVFPHWKQVIDVAHAAGKPVFFHTDGKADSIWDAFNEELGVRMLNPIQPNLQDLRDYKARFHGKMGCYGGIDTGTLHEKSPAQIREHVADLFEKMGAGGGLIMSTHDIDYSISDEQLDTFVDAIKACTY